MVVTLLGGRYKVIKLLGRGGFGQTYLAVDQHLPASPTCVIKQFKPKSTHPERLKKARELFDREARVLHQLGEYEQIPRLFAHFQQDNEFYLVQEYIEGHNLKKELVPYQPLAEEKVIALLREILEILEFVHSRDVIHRDLKPANLIRRQGDGRIVLIDFGAVKQVEANTPKLSSQPTVIGSLGYMPYEQRLGYPQFSSDIYAVGMLGLQALTGIKASDFPRDPETNEVLWREMIPVSEKLGDILEWMTRYDCRDRAQTATEVLTALAPLAPAEGRKLRKWQIGVALGILLVLIGGIGWWYYESRTRPGSVPQSVESIYDQ